MHLVHYSTREIVCNRLDVPLVILINKCYTNTVYVCLCWSIFLECILPRVDASLQPPCALLRYQPAHRASNASDTTPVDFTRWYRHALHMSDRRTEGRWDPPPFDGQDRSQYAGTQHHR